MLQSKSFQHALAHVSTFRDEAACARVREISREKITEHSNPEFKISVIDDRKEFYTGFARDLTNRIRTARDASKPFVAILPVGPVPQYDIAADLINRERLSLRHVHTFNMDEYADEEGNTAPVTCAGSFQGSMWQSFFSKIEADLRPLDANNHFPTSEVIDSYS